ncbi:alanyl-tRNA editing protein [Halobaculum litoreum]|uniref:alanyl-tRNA editing protein n=1 Tax=Halobaculum litoreum TaxID=3031998 RepID=UPI0024C332FD|nr:DHHA1 domain-containing protein [Halobaculum sp. DT92]
MGHTLAAEHPEVRAFEATVESVDGRAVTLSETYFYPEGGGQPADRGTLGGVSVADVRAGADGVVHTLAEAPAFDAGDAVAGVVDDDYRTYCMRAHTASHVLYGAGRRVLDDLGYGGFGITDEKVRVDFRTSTDVTDDVLVELERLVNRAVWDSRDVSWAERPVDEARGDEAVAFNTKTEEDVMADADTVRVVTVAGWDAAACGGTHVANTREIGPVTVLDRSNPGEGLTRVEFAVGPAGIDRRADTHRGARAAARELGVAVADLPDAVARVADERDRLAADLEALREEVLVGRLRALEAVGEEGRARRVGVVAGFEANAVGAAAQTLVDEPDGPDAVAAVGDGDAPFVVVASAGDLDAGDVVDAVTDAFGGGGGGSPRFAQGGGLAADPDEVAAFLREF